MASVRYSPVRKGTVCLTCGDKGETKLLIYCRKCRDSAVHHYCMDDASPSDDNINWVCWDCAPQDRDTKSIPEIPGHFEEPAIDPTSRLGRHAVHHLLGDEVGLPSHQVLTSNPSPTLLLQTRFTQSIPSIYSGSHPTTSVSFTAPSSSSSAQPDTSAHSPPSQYFPQTFVPTPCSPPILGLLPSLSNLHSRVPGSSSSPLGSTPTPTPPHSVRQMWFREWKMSTRHGRGKGPMIRGGPSQTADTAGRVKGRNVIASARRCHLPQTVQDPPCLEGDQPRLYASGSGSRYEVGPSSSRHRGDAPDHSEEEEKEKGDDDGGDDWLLCEPAPGGPMDISIIPSFGGHVALDVWHGRQGPSERLLKLQTRRMALQAWRGPANDECQRMLHESGVYFLRDCMLSRHNGPLVSAFVERWQPDTNTFHMPFGEMSITLHDVYYILGLPIDGLSVSHETSRDDMIAITAEILSVSPTEMEAIWVRGGPSFAQLAERCGDDMGAPAVSRARGYLTYLLGCTLFVDKSSHRIKPTFVPLIRDIEAVSEYCWGAATLAYLLRQLGMASRSGARQISGCLTLLEAWIYEYFPSLAPAPSGGYQHGQPRARKWQGSGRGASSKPERVREYRRILDGLTEHDVNWLPFGRDVVAQVPRTLYHGTVRFLDVIEPYQPNRFLRQFGYLQIIPTLPLRPLTNSKRDRRAKAYKVTYHEMDREWMTPGAYRLKENYYAMLAVPPYQAAPGYMTWFLGITHPRICPGKEDRYQERAEVEPCPYPAIYDLTRLLYPYYNQGIEIPADIGIECGSILEPFARYLRLGEPVAEQKDDGEDQDVLLRPGR